MYWIQYVSPAFRGFKIFTQTFIVGPKGCRPYSCFSPPPPSSSPPSAIKPNINKTSVFRRFQHSNQHFIHRRKEDSTGVHLEKTNTTTKTNTKTNTRTKTKWKFKKYLTYAIFSKSRGCKDIKYDIFSMMTQTRSRKYGQKGLPTPLGKDLRRKKCQEMIENQFRFAELRSLIGWGTTFDLRKAEISETH